MTYTVSDIVTDLRFQNLPSIDKARSLDMMVKDKVLSEKDALSIAKISKSETEYTGKQFLITPESVERITQPVTEKYPVLAEIEPETMPRPLITEPGKKPIPIMRAPTKIEVWKRAEEEQIRPQQIPKLEVENFGYAPKNDEERARIEKIIFGQGGLSDTEFETLKEVTNIPQGKKLNKLGIKTKFDLEKKRYEGGLAKPSDITNALEEKRFDESIPGAAFNLLNTIGTQTILIAGAEKLLGPGASLFGSTLLGGVGTLAVSELPWGIEDGIKEYQTRKILGEKPKLEDIYLKTMEKPAGAGVFGLGASAAAKVVTKIGITGRIANTLRRKYGPSGVVNPLTGLDFNQSPIQGSLYSPTGEVLTMPTPTLRHYVYDWFSKHLQNFANTSLVTVETATEKLRKSILDNLNFKDLINKYKTGKVLLPHEVEIAKQVMETQRQIVKEIVSTAPETTWTAKMRADLIEQAEQQASIIAAKEKRMIFPLLSPEDKAFLDSKTKKLSILQSLRKSAVDLSDKLFYENSLAHLPEFVDDLRILKGIPLDARKFASEKVLSIIGNLEKSEYEQFRKIVIMRDYLQTAERQQTQGLKVILPEGYSPETIRQKLREYTLRAEQENPKILEAVSKHFKLMQDIGQDLVNRGKIQKTFIRDEYFPHKVMDYMEEMKDYAPGFPRKLKGSFRPYLKQRIGSLKEIDLDYIDVMYKHLAKVNIDNQMDDAAELLADKYNIARLLTRKEKISLFGGNGQVEANKIYTIGNKRYKGWRLSNIHQFKDKNESEMFNLLHEEMPINKKVYLLPEEIATRLDIWKKPVDITPVEQAIRSAVSYWKRVTLNFAGIPFHFMNLTGDLMNAYRVAGPEVFGNINDAIKVMRPDTSDAFQQAKILAEKLRVIGMGSGYTGIEIRKMLHPEFEKFYGIREKLKYTKWNPLNLNEMFSEFRENVPRMALFLTNMKRIEQGKPLLAMGMRNDLLDLTGLRAAAKIAREAPVDYGAVSPDFQRYIRDNMFPFATFYFKNTENWGKYIAEAPTDYAIKFGVPYLVTQKWNYQVAGKEEENLPDWQKYSPHIWLPWIKDDFGRSLMVRFQTPQNMFLQMTGMSTLYPTITEMQRKISVARTEEEKGKIIKDGLFNLITNIPKGPVEATYNLLNFFYGAVIDVLSNKNHFTGSPILSYMESRSPEATRRKTFEYLSKAILTPLGQYYRAINTVEPEYIHPVAEMLLDSIGGVRGKFLHKYVDTKELVKSKTMKEEAEIDSKEAEKILKIREIWKDALFKQYTDPAGYGTAKILAENEIKKLAVEGDIKLTPEQTSIFTTDNEFTKFYRTAINQNMYQIKEKSKRIEAYKTTKELGSIMLIKRLQNINRLSLLKDYIEEYYNERRNMGNKHPDALFEEIFLNDLPPIEREK